MDHWWSTFAPSSSTSRLTSLIRSGFAWKVCTPFAVSVVSIRYFGIAPPRVGCPSLLALGPFAGGEMEKDNRGADEEERREHEVGGGDRPAAARLGADVD